MISHEKKFVYIHIPKNAGTSIEKAFGCNHDQFSNGENHDHRTLRHYKAYNLSAKHFKSLRNLRIGLQSARLRMRKSINPNAESTDFLTPGQYESYYKFAFVRNPWARAYSWYKNVLADEKHRNKHGIDKNEKMPLADFLVKHKSSWGLNSQLYWLEDFDGSIPLDFIGYFETLQDSFDLVCEQMEIPKLSLPHIYGGGNASYLEAYDDESKSIVAERYSKEIELFGYNFEGRINNDAQFISIPGSEEKLIRA